MQQLRDFCKALSLQYSGRVTKVDLQLLVCQHCHISMIWHHAGKIISKIAHESSQPKRAFAWLHGLCVCVYNRNRRLCMHHRAAEKKNVAGCSTIDHCIVEAMASSEMTNLPLLLWVDCCIGQS